MSQAELARKVGITREYVNRLEAGQYDATVGLATRLAKALGVSVMALVDPRKCRELMDPRETLRRLKLGQVLREAALGARTWESFEGLVPVEDLKRAAATRNLMRAGLIKQIGGSENRHTPRIYEATERGRKFLRDNRLDVPSWTDRVHKVEFP